MAKIIQFSSITYQNGFYAKTDPNLISLYGLQLHVKDKAILLYISLQKVIYNGT